MNIVYLILAHKNAKQLNRLIDRLKGANTFFVLHIDAKCNLAEYKDAIRENDANIHFVYKRVNCNWGKFSIVEATLNGLKYIVKSIKDADRVVLLSAQDYPIKKINYINDFFSNQPEAIFINHFTLPYKKWLGGGTFRFPNYERINSIMAIHAGAQWWSFPMSVVKKLLKMIVTYPAFTKYFSTVIVPDESFFQTLLFNSGEPFIDNVTNGNLTFTAWEPPYNHPNTLTIGDFDTLRASELLFARKFDEQIDSHILNRIDSEILGVEMATPSPSPEVKPGINPVKRIAKQAFLFMTNKDTKPILNAYNSFKNAAGNFGNVKLLFHNAANGNISKGITQLDPFLFDESILHTLGYKPLGPGFLPGSDHFPLLHFYLHNPDYEYYWKLEDDVRYNASWKDFLQFFDAPEINADFISAHIMHYADHPHWRWWSSLRNPYTHMPNIYKVSSFNPIIRISNAALATLHRQLLAGWQGHHEVLIPTLLNFAGHSLMDFGGDGKYVPSSWRNRFYENPGTGAVIASDTSTVRYRPLIDKLEMNKPLLYHPVKE